MQEQNYFIIASLGEDDNNTKSYSTNAKNASEAAAKVSDFVESQGHYKPNEYNLSIGYPSNRTAQYQVN